MLFLLDGGPKFDGFGGESLLLLVAACAALGLWAVVLAWRWFATYPYLPDEGPASGDFGDEPPAVANLLVNRWRVSRPAVAATVLDLAARHLLGVEQYGDEFVIRVRENRLDGQRLNAYEQQLFDHIRTRATGGSAPVQALALGEEVDANRFWKRFRAAVVDDARKRGLARTRWSPRDWTLIGGTLALALGLFALAFGVAHLAEDTGSGRGHFDRWDWFYLAVGAWLAIMALIASQRDLRGTDKGVAACSRWLGVRNYLRGTSAFDDAPAAAVTIWERNLSYAAALGVAHDAVHDLPFDAEDPGTAWSRSTGMWREIRVSYPTRFDFGRRPLWVALSGLARAVFWGGIGFVVIPVVAQVLWDAVDSGVGDQGTRGERFLVLFFLAGFGALGLYCAFRFLGGVIRLYRGGLDLTQRREIEGYVVKVHQGRVALDDGKASETVAWFQPQGAPSLPLGTKLWIEVTPHLWYVRDLRRISVPPAPASQQPSPIPSQTAPAFLASAADAAAAQGGWRGLMAAGRTLASIAATDDTLEPPAAASRDALAIALDENAVRELTGMDLALAKQHEPDAGMGISTHVYADREGSKLSVRCVPLTGGAARMADMMKGQLERVHASAVPGLGEEAYWAGDSHLMVRGARAIVMVDVNISATAPEERLAIASDVAKRVLLGWSNAGEGAVDGGR